jgi:hypothetical protein
MKYITIILLCIGYSCSNMNNDNVKYCNCNYNHKDIIINELILGNQILYKDIIFGYENRFGNHFKISNINNFGKWIFIEPQENINNTRIDNRYSTLSYSIFNTQDSVKNIYNFFKNRCIVSLLNIPNDLTILGMFTDADSNCNLSDIKTRKAYRIGICKNKKSIPFNDLRDTIKFINDSIFIIESKFNITLTKMILLNSVGLI